MADDQKPIELTDSSKIKESAQYLGSLMTNVRERRRSVELKWLNHHSAWMGERVKTNFVSEYFKHTFPAMRRAIEKFVTRVSQQLLPSTDFFETFPYDEGSDPAGKEAEACRSYMSFLLSKRIKIRSLVKQLARSNALYNRAIAKTGVEVVEAPVRVGRRFEYIRQVWPTSHAVDPFAFYVWPETASNDEDAVVMFEDNMMPWDRYEEHVKAGAAEKIERRVLSNPQWPTYLVQRLAYSGITEPSSTGAGARDETEEQKDTPPVDFVAVSEVWFRSEGRWKQAWLVWNVPDSPRIVRYKSTEWPRPPYRLSISRSIPGQHYTTGMADDLYPLQGLLDDQINLSLEGQAMAMSGVAAVDPDMVSRANSIVWRPRAKWLMKPEGVKFLQPPDVTEAAIRGVQLTMSFIEGNSGVEGLASGNTQKGMPRAGFAVSTLVSLATADIRDVAQMLEEEILTPMLSDIYTAALLWTPPTQLIRIPGGQDINPQAFTIDDMVGSWYFRWVGSLQSQDMQVKAQRMIALTGVLSKMLPLLAPQLQAEGKKINWELYWKRMWRDSMGERGADSLIIPMSPEEQQNLMMQQMLAQQSPGVPPRPSGPSGPSPAAPATPQAAAQQAGRQQSESVVGKALA